MPSRPPLTDPERRPEVIVDFAVSDGLLLVSLTNIGPRSAWRVTTRFDKPFRGLGGAKRISALALFRRVEFMPPGKPWRSSTKGWTSSRRERPGSTTVLRSAGSGEPAKRVAADAGIARTAIAPGGIR